MKVRERAGIKLATPGSAVRLTSVARHIADCATRPGKKMSWNVLFCADIGVSTLWMLNLFLCFQI